MNNIVWLASYPKSGNTWFRVFLSNLLSDGDEPVSINNLMPAPIAGDRFLLDQALGYSSSDLTAEEVERLRPAADALWADQRDDIGFRKIHDAYRPRPGAPPIVSARATRAAIYVIRNPLDVCLSYAHHRGVDNFDSVIDMMIDPDHCLSGKTGRLHRQLRQRVQTWSEHVESWLAAPFPVHVIRYEDMTARPRDSFQAAIQSIGLRHDRPAVARAIENSRFQRLQNEERAVGFKERMPKTKSFFRHGRIGAWREKLTGAQVDRLVDHLATVMQRFDYLDKAGQPR